MDNPQADEDPLFERTCLRYGLPVARGKYVALNELRGWSSGELSAIFDKIHGLPAASDTVRRPYSWQPQHWVKPASSLVERAANQQLALCVNTCGDWQTLKSDYIALSHVWDEGLYADPRNRGLPRSIIEQLFAMLQPLDAQWLWLDSLAVPGGRRDLTLNEELVKTKLINNMDNVYRNAKYVVILDTLLLRLQSQDPVDVGVTVLFGQWASRVWTYQEVKLASHARILTKAGFVDPRDILESLANSAIQDGPKTLRLYESLKRVLNPDSSSETSILDIALSSANRSTSRDIDYCRGFYPCLGLKWNEKFSRDRGVQYIMESHEEEAPLLLGLHGSPLLIEGYAWAPAYLCGLNGTPLSNVSWEQNGLRREWYSYHVTSSQEKHLPESVRRGGLLLGIAGPEGMVFCACALSHRERPEAVIGFKLAIDNQSAFLLSELSLEALARYRGPGPPPTVLLVKQANVENEAFIYMTAALLALSAGVPASPQDWLIYHQSPLLEAKSSDNQATSATSVKGNNNLPHDGESPLHRAARLSKVAEVRRIISLPCNIDAEDAAGWTPLQIASHLDHLQVVQILLEGEASVGHVGRDDGLAALHLAIMARNPECVNALLEARADANQLTSSKLTPLMLAAELGSLDVVQQLLHAGARVDFACQLGRGTPLHAAVQSNSIAILKLLLESPGAGKMLNWKDANGSSPGWLAFKKADHDALSLLARDMALNSPLVVSIFRGVQIALLAFVLFGLLLLGLPMSLALDFGLLLLTGRVDIALGPSLSSLWSKYRTPVAWTLNIILALFSRRGQALMAKLWTIVLLVHLLPFQRLKPAVEAESFRWSTDTVFYSRLLVPATPLLEFGWPVIKKLGPFVCYALTTGGLLRYFREPIFGRSLSQSMRDAESGLDQVAPFITFFWTGAVLNLTISMAFYLCRLVGLLFGCTAWEVSIHVIATMCIGTLHTLWLRQFYLDEVTHRRLQLEMSLSLTVLTTLWLGASSWLFLVLVWLLWQGSLLPGEVLLGGMTGESKMQTYIHRLVLWITFGQLHARTNLFKQWVAKQRLHRRGIKQEKDVNWVRHTLMGALIYCPIVATLTVGKILWDCVSTGSWMTGFQKQ